MGLVHPQIDFNLDLGEGYGIWSHPWEDELIHLATSVNLACGFHAGDPQWMRAGVEAAKRLGVVIGAHPGLPDLQGFGRRVMVLTPAEIGDLVTYQLGALNAFVTAADLRLRHIKLHGELNRQCMSDPAAALAYVEAVARFDSHLAILTRSSGEIWKTAQQLGAPVLGNHYLDFPPRSDLNPHAPGRPPGRDPEVTPDFVADSVFELVTKGTVPQRGGGSVTVNARSVSIHTDTPDSVRFAQAVIAGVERAGARLSAEVLAPELSINPRA